MGFLNEIINSSIWEWDVWGKLDTALNVIALISIFLGILRYINNRNKQVWRNDVSITEHDRNYDYERYEKEPIYTKICLPTEYCVLIKFKPVNCIVRKMEIIRLNTEGKKQYVLKKFENLTPDTPVCFLVERAELIPRYRIKWYSDFGEYCVHDLSENLRNGNNTVEGAIYHQTWLSRIRKILGII